MKFLIAMVMFFGSGLSAYSHSGKKRVCFVTKAQASQKSGKTIVGDICFQPTDENKNEPYSCIGKMVSECPKENLAKVCELYDKKGKVSDQDALFLYKPFIKDTDCKAVLKK